jgi:hypothetical protein
MLNKEKIKPSNSDHASQAQSRLSNCSFTALNLKETAADSRENSNLLDNGLGNLCFVDQSFRALD